MAKSKVLSPLESDGGDSSCSLLSDLLAWVRFTLMSVTKCLKGWSVDPYEEINRFHAGIHFYCFILLDLSVFKRFSLLLFEKLSKHFTIIYLNLVTWTKQKLLSTKYNYVLTKIGTLNRAHSGRKLMIKDFLPLLKLLSRQFFVQRLMTVPLSWDVSNYLQRKIPIQRSSFHRPLI